jgi:hypothetical protein
MLNALDVMPNYVSRFKVGGAQALNAFVGKYHSHTAIITVCFERFQVLLIASCRNSKMLSVAYQYALWPFCA